MPPTSCWPWLPPSFVPLWLVAPVRSEVRKTPASLVACRKPDKCTVVLIFAANAQGRRRRTRANRPTAEGALPAESTVGGRRIACLVRNPHVLAWHRECSRSARRLHREGQLWIVGPHASGRGDLHGRPDGVRLGRRRHRRARVGGLDDSRAAGARRLGLPGAARRCRRRRARRGRRRRGGVRLPLCARSRRRLRPRGVAGAPRRHDRCVARLHPALAAAPALGERSRRDPRSVRARRGRGRGGRAVRGGLQWHGGEPRRAPRARAAVYARMRDEGGDATALTPEPPKDVAQARRERVQMLSRLEAAWREFTARNAPPEALRALIAARQLDWMRFTVQTVLAPDVEVAREVTLCVREDGRPIEQVAAAARLRAETIEWWLEDVEPAVREALVGAMPGDVLGPLALKEGHLILAVGNKRLT